MFRAIKYYEWTCDSKVHLNLRAEMAKTTKRQLPSGWEEVDDPQTFIPEARPLLGLFRGAHVCPRCLGFARSWAKEAAKRAIQKAAAQERAEEYKSWTGYYPGSKRGMRRPVEIVAVNASALTQWAEKCRTRGKDVPCQHKQATPGQVFDSGKALSGYLGLAPYDVSMVLRATQFPTVDLKGLTIKYAN